MFRFIFNGVKYLIKRTAQLALDSVLLILLAFGVTRASVALGVG